MAFKFYRLKMLIRRALVKQMKLNRPTAYPFITGDGFRALAEHFFDEVSDLDPLSVNNRDIVYVRGDFLHEFFTKKHPLIKNKYILISNNGDVNIKEEYIKYIDEKIIHWYAQNVFVAQSKITPVPIGLTNTFCNFIGTLSDLQKIIEDSKETPKKSVMTYGFSLISGKERMALHNLLQSHKHAHEIERVSQANYFREMSKYQFCVSPEGNGADCHRTWECFYLGIVPIVKKSQFTEYFKSLGLPLLIVEDWKEVERFDEQFLAETYQKLKTGFSHPAIYMKYWMDIILEQKMK